VSPEDAQTGVRALPAYLVKTYTWAYLHPRSPQLLDRHLVVNSILWGNYRRLVDSACAEFEPGQQVLQAASAYGDLSCRLATRVGEGGHLDIIDIAPLQVEHCRKKVTHHRNVQVRVADAAEPGGSGYDGACCFFLLHEVPEARRRPIVDALLKAVRVGGKLVIVDYHRPARWHPLRPVMWAVFRSLEPYAESLLASRIPDLASHRSDISARIETRFGDLYQKAVLVRLR
jgi:ubiquinone/menaquinone biosynthesis C-methylase UbiE